MFEWICSFGCSKLNVISSSNGSNERGRIRQWCLESILVQPMIEPVIPSLFLILSNLLSNYAFRCCYWRSMLSEIFLATKIGYWLYVLFTPEFEVSRSNPPSPPPSVRLVHVVEKMTVEAPSLVSNFGLAESAPIYDGTDNSVTHSLLVRPSSSEIESGKSYKFLVRAINSCLWWWIWSFVDSPNSSNGD